MLTLFALFWYCYDDWLSQSLNAPPVGEVPFIIWFIVFLVCLAIDGD